MSTKGKKAPREEISISRNVKLFLSQLAKIVRIEIFFLSLNPNESRRKAKGNNNPKRFSTSKVQFLCRCLQLSFRWLRSMANIIDGDVWGLGGIVLVKFRWESAVERLFRDFGEISDYTVETLGNIWFWFPGKMLFHRYLFTREHWKDFVSNLQSFL